MTPEEIENIFGEHESSADVILLRDEIRDVFIEVAKILEMAIPDDPKSARMKALMHTKLEEAELWASKAVSITTPLVGDIPVQVPEDVTTVNNIAEQLENQKRAHQSQHAGDALEQQRQRESEITTQNGFF